MAAAATAAPTSADANAAAAAASGVPVTLHVYDLTRGMAAALSPLLLGRAIAGVWHTGLVAHGREFYFGGGPGGGVAAAPAGATPFGAPTHALCLGTTEVPPEMLDDLVDELRGRFPPEAYHILSNNCNHFTSELAQLLTGEEIPDWVLRQADGLLDTPLGRQLAPLILPQLEAAASFGAGGGTGGGGGGGGVGGGGGAAAGARAAAAAAAQTAAQTAAAAATASAGAAGGGAVGGAAAPERSAAAAAGAAAAARAAAAAAVTAAAGGAGRDADKPSAAAGDGEARRP